MTVYGPRLYFGPLDAPDAPSDDSSCSCDTITTTPPPTPTGVIMANTTTTSLDWQQLRPGHYQADLDDESGVLRWIVVRTASSRWEIVSITTGWERRRHGAAYTLREAKTAVANFHRSNNNPKEA